METAGKFKKIEEVSTSNCEGKIDKDRKTVGGNFSMESNEVCNLRTGSRASLVSLRSQTSQTTGMSQLKNMFANLNKGPGSYKEPPVGPTSVEELKSLLMEFEDPERTFLVGISSKVKAFYFQEWTKSLYLGFENGEVRLIRLVE